MTKNEDVIYGELYDELCDELTSLRAIYGEDNVLFDEVSSTVELNLVSEGRRVSVTLIVDLPSDYPRSPPTKMRIETRPPLTPSTIRSTEAALRHIADDRVGQAHLFDLISTLEDEAREKWGGSVGRGGRGGARDDVLSERQRKQQQRQKDDEVPWLLLVKLDHIRDERRYSKSLRKLAEESSVAVAVFPLSDSSAERLVAASGGRRGVDRFLAAWKSRNVDVDSRGRPCKERMMTVGVSRRGDDEGRCGGVIGDGGGRLEFCDSNLSKEELRRRLEDWGFDAEKEIDPTFHSIR